MIWYIAGSVQKTPGGLIHMKTIVSSRLLIFLSSCSLVQDSVGYLGAGTPRFIDHRREKWGQEWCQVSKAPSNSGPLPKIWGMYHKP